MREINRTQALIVVEHDMQFIRMIASTVTVFHQGGVLIEDTVAEHHGQRAGARRLSRQAGGRMHARRPRAGLRLSEDPDHPWASPSQVATGEFVGILGHNGMGKSTLLKTLIGQLPATGGARRRSPTTEITRAPTHRRARLGLGYVPQGREIFPGLYGARQHAHGRRQRSSARRCSTR